LRNLCWSQPHQQLPGRSNSGPPWSMCNRMLKYNISDR
jgi:hypothetical protein